MTPWDIRNTERSIRDLPETIDADACSDPAHIATPAASIRAGIANQPAGVSPDDADAIARNIERIRTLPEAPEHANFGALGT